MPHTTGEKTIPLWRRLLLALGNLGFFVIATVVALRLFRGNGGNEASGWIRAVIVVDFLIALLGVDLMLRAVLLRPERQSPAEPDAPADQPRS